MRAAALLGYLTEAKNQLESIAVSLRVAVVGLVVIFIIILIPLAVALLLVLFLIRLLPQENSGSLSGILNFTFVRVELLRMRRPPLTRGVLAAARSRHSFAPLRLATPSISYEFV